MVKKRTYQDVVSLFEKENCKMLNTEEEFNEISKIGGNPKYKYLASCGHEHSVFFNVFLNRKTGVLCPSCVITRNNKNAKENMSKDKLQCLKLELSCINYFISLVDKSFDIVKAFDGCKADMIMKPKSVAENEWIGIQVKSTGLSKMGYGFHLNNDYEQCIILLISETDKRMWAIPYNDVKGQIKIAIGKNKSKYSNYEVTTDTVCDLFTRLYKETQKTETDILNTPTNIYQVREQEFRNYREEKIPFLKFVDNGMEGLVYDFMIDELKVQEKVAGELTDRANTFMFCLGKNNGLKKGKQNLVLYDIGDNDIYWLNCGDKKYFYVVPEKILVDKGYISNKESEKKTKRFIKIKPSSNKNSKSSHWLSNYLFDYENIDKEGLLYIIENCKPHSLQNEFIEHKSIDDKRG